jgi:hypothetical protein
MVPMPRRAGGDFPAMVIPGNDGRDLRWQPGVLFGNVRQRYGLSREDDRACFKTVTGTFPTADFPQLSVLIGSWSPVENHLQDSVVGG